MRKTLGLLLATVVITAAPAAAKVDNRVCPQIGQLAKVIMESRQIGVPMSEMMTTMIESGEKRVDELMEQMIKEAYRRPRYHSEVNQQRAAEDFQNELESMCYK